MSGWNFADVWETNAATVPDRDALVHGDTRITWAEMNRRANGLAAGLLGIDGAKRQDKVAQYMYNCAEFMESQFAIFKAGMVPVNTNYRYTDHELRYLWDNSDAIAVVFQGMFIEHIEHIRGDLPDLKLYVWVDDGTGPCPDWATPYESLAEAGEAENVSGTWGRSGDDLYMLYTGGTTGMPKGVMWPQDELMKVFRSNNPELPEEQDLDWIAANTLAPPTPIAVPCCPLMHGTGAFTSHAVMHGGGTVVTLTNHHFDPDELIDTIEREQVNRLAIVGDAFAKPIVRALDARGNPDISSLVAITSSGVMWSQETKDGLLRHHPNMMLVDAFSSSEALGMGQSVSSGAGSVKTAKFEIGERAIVIDDDGNRVEPGSGQMGRVAVKGILPIGYYKDEEKTAKTFVTIEGERYSTPGDYAIVEADGSLTLLGRGSVCINTGGEKVFPEEVEERLKAHPSIHDAVVVGVPDDRFGQAVTGVVEMENDHDLDADSVIAFVREELAGYKTPKRILTIDTIGRAANGKVDYKRLTDFATEQLKA